MTKQLFFLGKGGVGKSTLSAVEGIKLAEKDKNTLIVSMDPAHNLSDIFQDTFNEKPKTISKNLQIIEIDIGRQIKKYLNDIETKIKKAYRYLTAFNLENHFDIIRYSPAIEEYALLQAYAAIVKRHVDKDFIVFDMPPTALTIKFFNLPGLSLLWLEKLLTIRNRIIEKKQIITTVKMTGKSFETDKIKQNLLEQIKKYQNLVEVFQDENTSQLILVLNPDELSINESIKICDQLQSLQRNVNWVIINKYQDQDRIIFKPFKRIKMQYYPYSTIPLIGLRNLKNYIKDTNINSVSYL